MDFAGFVTGLHVVPRTGAVSVVFVRRCFSRLARFTGAATVVLTFCLDSRDPPIEPNSMSMFCGALFFVAGGGRSGLGGFRCFFFFFFGGGSGARFMIGLDKDVDLDCGSFIAIVGDYQLYSYQHQLIPVPHPGITVYRVQNALQ